MVFFYITFNGFIMYENETNVKLKANSIQFELIVGYIIKNEEDRLGSEKRNLP